MIVVVDTNIIIAAIIKPSITQELILKEELIFYTPEFLKDEIEDHKDEILEKARYSEAEFETILALIYSKIRIMPKKEYQYLKEEVLTFSPDKEDWPFLALAKHINAVLWSNDSVLKNQNQINVLTTEEILKKLQK